MKDLGWVTLDHIIMWKEQGETLKILQSIFTDHKTAAAALTASNLLLLFYLNFVIYSRFDVLTITVFIIGRKSDMATMAVAMPTILFCQLSRHHEQFLVVVHLYPSLSTPLLSSYYHPQEVKQLWVIKNVLYNTTLLFI